MNVIVMGSQASGKGTVIDGIKKKYSLYHLSTGDIFRKNIEEKTPLGDEAQKYINEGHLVPDETTISMLGDYLRNNNLDDNIVFDGFPRNLKQAEFLDGLIKIDKVILLKISDDLAIYRMSGRRICRDCGKIYSVNPDGFPQMKGESCECGGKVYQREDDQPEAIKKRLNTYKQETMPVIDFYDNKGILAAIDASRQINDIIADVDKTLQ